MTTRTGAVRWTREDDGIVVVTFDSDGARTNMVSPEHVAGVNSLLDHLRSTIDDVAGVLLTSSKDSFFAGPEFLPTDAPDRGAAWQLAAEFRQQLRDLETIGRPVAAALIGSALGGGFEIALAAHHRVGLDDPTVRWQLAERTMGILPAGGGTVRAALRVGMATAVRETVGEGVPYTPRWALRRGLVDELAPTREEVEDKARDWIRWAGPTGGGQPWDHPAYRVPGGVPGDREFDAELADIRAALDALDDDTAAARREILGVVLAALTEPVDTAFEMETAAFGRLAASPSTAPLVFAAFKRLRDRVEQGADSVDLRAARSWRTFTPGPRHPLASTFAPDAPDRVVEVPVAEDDTEATIAAKTAAGYAYGIPVLVRAERVPVLTSAPGRRPDDADFVDESEAALARVLLGR